MHKYLNATLKYSGEKKDEVTDIFGTLFDSKEQEENELILRCSEDYSVYDEDLLFEYLKEKCALVPQGETISISGYFYDENSAPSTQRIEATVVSKSFKLKTSYWYDEMDLLDYSDAEDFCDSNWLDYDESWEEFYEENKYKDMYDYGGGDIEPELAWQSEKIFP